VLQTLAFVDEFIRKIVAYFHLHAGDGGGCKSLMYLAL